jgi:chaperonin GroEL
MHKEFKFDDEARKEVLEGINIAVKAISSTLGPNGKLVSIRKQDGSVISTKDGVTVARNSIGLKSRFADMGARMVRAACNKSVEKAGDGTTATAILVGSLCNEGARLVSAGHNPVHLKNGIEAGVKYVTEELQKISTPISSSKEIEQVAVISSNGDVEVGSIVRQALDKVGNSGVITVEKGKSTTTELSVVNGYRYDRGYQSEYFANNDRLECHLEKARILVTDLQINNINVMTPILEACHKHFPGEPLLVIAGDVQGDALGLMVVNSMRKTLPSCAVRAPGYGARRVEMLQDICCLTGATFVSETAGMKLEQFDVGWLGCAEKVVVTAGTTTVVDGFGAPEDVESRVSQIRFKMESCSDDHERKQLEERLAKLVGGVAVVYVGGFSDEEVSERLDRWDDALGATRAAMEGGIVPGGGTALLRIARSIDVNSFPVELRNGVEVVRKAIQEPIRKIVLNSGKDPSEVMIGIVSNANPNFGYNAQTDKYEDLVESGVIDPTKVLKGALTHAASVASLVLVTRCGWQEVMGWKVYQVYVNILKWNVSYKTLGREVYWYNGKEWYLSSIMC